MDMADCSRTVFLESSDKGNEVIKVYEYESCSKFIMQIKASCQLP